MTFLEDDVDMVDCDELKEKRADVLLDCKALSGLKLWQ